MGLLRRHHSPHTSGLRGLDPVVQVSTRTGASLESVLISCCRYSQTRYKKTHEEGLNKFERELKTRVRSATGTW